MPLSRNASLVGFGDAAALAGDQRRGDGAGLAGQRRGDACADGLTQALHARPQCQVARHFTGGGVDARRRHRIADGADAGEPRLPPEVVVAGQCRLRRRHERRPQAHRRARLQTGERPVDGDTHAGRPLAGSEIAQRRDAQRQPLPACRACLDQLHEAAHLGAVHLLRQYRRAHPFDAQLGERETERGREQRRDEQRGKRRARAARCAPGEHHHHRNRRNQQRRLGRQREIGGDAGPDAYRQPAEPPLLLGLETARERRQHAAAAPHSGRPEHR